jgi:hypothetical protein
MLIRRGRNKSVYMYSYKECENIYSMLMVCLIYSDLEHTSLNKYMYTDPDY